MTTNISLNCAVCQQQLTKPITLSCGYTVCSTCLPCLPVDQSTFNCPVKQCNKETHLFGPNLLVDKLVETFIQDDYTQKPFNHENYASITNLLTCPIGNHCLEHPITSHCGHTFCKLCLLQYKISNNTCKLCQKRLPSYEFIQNQSINHLTSTILSIYHSYQYNNNDITSVNYISNNLISFDRNSSIYYENIPIHLLDFPVLPSQKLCIPIYKEDQRVFFLQSLLLCKQYQCLCFAVLKKNKANHKHQYGTIVKITNIKHRANDLLIQVIGLDRFQVSSVHLEIEDYIQADFTMKLESQDDLEPFASQPKHWTGTNSDKATHNILSVVTSLPPSPTMDNITNCSILIPPSSPPAEYYNIAYKQSQMIFNFISDLSESTPSNAFTSSVEGLLGPVWLESVQNLHGKLPPAEHSVAMCWWSAIILPVSNTERYHLLQTESLEDRLNIIVSWIEDMKSQWNSCKRAVRNSAARVGH